MKIIFCKIFLLVCTVSLFASCEKEESDRPLGIALEDLLAESYWVEEIQLIYKEKGSDELKTSKELMREFPWTGGPDYIGDAVMGRIYIEPETHQVRKYYRCAVETPPYYAYQYTRNEYSIEYKEREATIRITSPVVELDVRGAVTGSDMKVVSWNESQIVFEAPIKPFVRVWWLLEEDDSGRKYVGMRVTWKKLTPDLFMREATLID